jgi:hypothetical protein
LPEPASPMPLKLVGDLAKEATGTKPPLLSVIFIIIAMVTSEQRMRCAC